MPDKATPPDSTTDQIRRLNFLSAQAATRNHLLLSTLRRLLPAVAPPNLVPGWAYGESSGRRPIRPGTLEARVLREWNQGVRGGVGSTAINAFGSLLQHACRNITPPPPLPDLDFDAQHRPFLSISGGNYSYAAATFPHLAICYPDNFWRWILFNDNAIHQTPDYTRSIIIHELQHAADIKQSLDQFQSEIGVPPPPPSDFSGRCRPINEGVRQGWQDPWGRHVNTFIEFYERDLSNTRHLKIVVGQRDVNIDDWSAAEKIQWIRSILDHIPEDFPSDGRLPGETEVLALYGSSNEILQEAIVSEFAAFFNDIFTAERNLGSGSGRLSLDEDTPAATRPGTSVEAQRRELTILRRRGRIVLNRFSPILDRVVTEHFHGHRRSLELITREGR